MSENGAAQEAVEVSADATQVRRWDEAEYEECRRLSCALVAQVLAAYNAPPGDLACAAESAARALNRLASVARWLEDGHH